LRIGSIIVILLGIPFLLFVGLQIFSGEPANPTIFLSLLLLVGMIAGMGIAWWKEGLGAAITLVSIAGYFFLSGTFPGVGARQGFPMFVGPVNLLFALIIPGYHPEMSPQARWVPFSSWVLSIVPVALFLASWWLRREQPQIASASGS
jgi:hypothetical protein